MANYFKCSYCGEDGTFCRCILEHGGGRTFPSTHRAEAYNACHGTQIVDDDCLDKVLELERKIKNF